MKAALLLALALGASAARAEGLGACHFDTEALQFQGTALEQASCLLRPVAPRGVVDAQPAQLPALLRMLIGQPASPALRASLAAYATQQGLTPADLGGNLQARPSRAGDDAAEAPAARYFVIHDTSTPWLGDAPAFPPDDDATLNAIQQFAGPNAVAHVFVNRLGQTVLGHDFAQPWRATKFESKTVGTPAKGLFLHIELMQPRRRDPAGSPRNDVIAPLPGFTAAQYEKLALLYTAASARAGRWLIPAFHAAIDEGQPDAHDDPQHFEIENLAAALASLRHRLDSLATPG